MKKDKPRADTAHLSYDSMAEDLFGLNIRGLKSIFAAWTRPRAYFAAAKTAEWSDEFTPSIRLWLSFFALFSALKFWWFGSNEGMIGAFASGFENAGLPLPEGMTYQDVGTEAVLAVFGWIPAIQIVSMFLVSLVYPVWGERTTVTLRQRYLFIIITPSASIMPLFLSFMLLVPQTMISAYGVLLAIVAFTIDFQTGYRGAFSGASRFGRAWRAGLLALVLVTINTVLSIGAQIVGILLIAQKYSVAAPS